MAKTKLTKFAVDAAQPQAQAIELRDTLFPGCLCKITPAGRKVFMLQYRTQAGHAPYILDFLGLRDTWSEGDLEAACGFHGHPATHSMNIRPLIPR